MRTEPAPLAQYRVRFEAPAQSIFLFIRGWKKFAITNVEMDLNLDAISLRACDGQAMDQGGWMPQGQPAEMGMRPQDGPMMPQEPMGERPGTGGPAMGRPDDMGASCLYIVKPGDMLSAIAEHYGVSMAAIARANGVTDADAIYAGQKFEIPGCRDDMATAPAMESAPMQDGPMRGPEMAEAPAMMPASMSAPTMGPTLRPDAPLMPEQSGREQAMGAMPMPRGERTYVVQPGDMLTGIALDQGIDAFDLASANGIDNMNMIYVGQILVIPN